MRQSGEEGSRRAFITPASNAEFSTITRPSARPYRNRIFEEDTMPRAARLSAAILITAMLAAGSLAGSTASAAGAAPIKTASARVLVNQQGMTLYVYSADKPNKSTCTGGCAKYWPPATVTAGATVPSAMAGLAGKFATTKRADGSSQLTYDGAPLYTFLKDKKPGDMAGQGVEAVWWTVVVSTTKPTTPASANALVKTAPTKILVNAAGMTLYVFSADKMNKSTCTGGCAKYWPPLELAAGATAPAAMPGIKGTFATAARADGSSQLTYDGAPLYTWLKDKKPGDITGQGVGGVWWVVSI
jgi:predicted lipoprotein with Yx(FWY)xxD motif